MTPETATCCCGNPASRHATGYICGGSIYHDPLAAKNTDPDTAQTIYVDVTRANREQASNFVQNLAKAADILNNEK